MENNKLLDLLYNTLGPYKFNTGNEYSFVCPLCSRSDNAKKLTINLDTSDKAHFQRWHCWRNPTEHKGTNIISLFRRISASELKISQAKQILTEMSVPTYDINDIEPNLFSTPKEIKTEIIELPQHFHSFAEVKMDDPEYRNAMLYIKSRNITGSDIIKNNIGYCDGGPYRGYIILPSYDANRNLNYFVARKYYDTVTMRYKNPLISKNIIFNEIHINWNERIYLVEGVFDALAIKRNAIPLLGKTIGSALKKKIYEMGVKEICICLDNDAIKQSVNYIEEFMKNGISVYFTQLTDKDPSKIGFQEMTRLLKQSLQINFQDLIKLKMAL